MTACVNKVPTLEPCVLPVAMVDIWMNYFQEVLSHCAYVCMCEFNTGYNLFVFSSSKTIIYFNNKF